MNTYPFTAQDAADRLHRFPDWDVAEDLGENIEAWIGVIRASHNRPAATQPIDTAAYVPADKPPVAAPLDEHRPIPDRRRPYAGPAVQTAPAFYQLPSRPQKSFGQEQAAFERAILFLYAVSVLFREQPPALQEACRKSADICEQYYIAHKQARRWRFYIDTAKEKEKRPDNNFLSFGKLVIDTYHQTREVPDSPDVSLTYAADHYARVRERALHAYKDAGGYRQYQRA
ncbi:MAG: hypothetical protein PHX68_00315 [Alphaproteobacteria bacterium]|nr:hypothetical protein [Alphaproteobacteria bacterium]